MEANRYFVIMFIEKMTETFTSKDEYKNFIEKYNKENRDEKNPVVSGYLETIHFSEPGTWLVKYSRYKKITIKKPLEVVDKFITNKFEDEQELREFYSKDATNSNGKFYIGYMYNGGVHTLPIFYKKDKVYTDYESLTKLMTDNYNSETFLAKVWSNKKLNAPEYRKNVEYYLEKLQVAYGKYVMYIGPEDLLAEEVKNAIRDFMKAWCVKDGVVNQRRVREVGSIVKNCLSEPLEKSETPKSLKREKKSKVNTQDDITLF